MLSDSPPNPKDFPDYDEYRAALEEWEWQEEQKDDPDGAKAKEADARLETWARFAKGKRVPRCIPSCRKPLCLEREGCIWVELQTIQTLWNEWFFDESLTEEQMFVDEESIENRTKLGLCSVLPSVWQKEGSYEHQVLRFFLNVWDLISMEKVNDELESFGRNVYWFTFSVLFGEPWKEKEEAIKRMEKFLQSNEVLPNMASLLILKSFEGLNNSRKLVDF